MIYTSCHKYWNTNICKNRNIGIRKDYAISGNRGKDANWIGECYSKLAPKKEFWKVWHDNIGKIPEEENTKYYIREYYIQVLSKLDPEEVYNELNNSVLLCYEENTDFCHRHIVAAWFELFLVGVRVPEIKANNLKIEEVDKPTNIKKYLEEIIKSTKDMKGYNDLRSLYLMEKNNKEKVLVK